MYDHDTWLKTEHKVGTELRTRCETKRLQEPKAGPKMATGYYRECLRTSIDMLDIKIETINRVHIASISIVKRTWSSPCRILWSKSTPQEVGHVGRIINASQRIRSHALCNSSAKGKQDLLSMIPTVFDTRHHRWAVRLEVVLCMIVRATVTRRSVVGVPT